MTTLSSPRIVICGAGIAGCAAAWQLAETHGVRNIVLVDERAPLTLTSDKSTECYRNWWPGPDEAMVRLTNRSIDLMEALATETGNRFRLNRRGYLFATADQTTAEQLEQSARTSCALGAGPFRLHAGGVHDPAYPAPAAEGFAGAPDGADVIRDPALLRRQFPWLTPHAVAVVHARRCGWLSAQQLGMLLLERARAAGTQLVRGRLTSVELTGGRVSSVTVQSAGATERFAAEVLINAAGPYASAVGRLAGLDLPVVCEGHVKIAFDDHLGAVPRDAPLLIWSDPVALPWSEAERDTLAGTDEGQPLLGTFPAGVHGRPEGAGRQVLLYWTYAREAREVPTYPLEWNPHYPEIALRGMSVMIPALAGYLERLPKPSIDGGYYAKTPDNRPLVGALAVPGAFALSALSGYGIMASLGAAEQLASLVVGDATAPWTSCFDPGRFDDPQYAASLADDTGQL